MSFDLIYKTYNEYKDCTKCELHKLRQANNESVIIGEGTIDSRCLIITDKPDYLNKEQPTILEKTSEEVFILNKIFEKVGISHYSYYLTSAISCKGEVTPSNIDSCQDRLRKVLYSINPKVIVLMGKAAYYAFHGKIPTIQEGHVDKVNNKEVVFTYNIKYYISARDEQKPGYKAMGEDMMNHWTAIANMLK